VRRLLPTAIDSYSFHERIVEAKQAPRRSRLEAANGSVAARVRELENSGPFDLPVDTLGHTCIGGACEPCLYEDLRHLWTVTTKPLGELKAALTAEFESTNVNDCPYCGTDPAEGFDHYLPKSAYPEFAAAAVNLVRACDRCNGFKRERSPNGSRRFLHPALDPLELPFVRCTIDPRADPPHPHFGIDIAAAELAGIPDEVGFHFRELQLHERFRKVAAPELAAFLIEIQHGAGRSEVSARIADHRADAHQKTWGPNRWSTALYRALADWLRSSKAATEL
jgi:hypothetical protein